MFGMLRGPQAIPAAPVHDQTVIHHSSLLPPNLRPGARTDLAAFCARYELSDNILALLAEAKYTGTHAFRHIQVKDLQEIGFRPGEIADLKDAVLLWVNHVD